MSSPRRKKAKGQGVTERGEPEPEPAEAESEMQVDWEHTDLQELLARIKALEKNQEGASVLAKVLHHNHEQRLRDLELAHNSGNPAKSDIARVRSAPLILQRQIVFQRADKVPFKDGKPESKWQEELMASFLPPEYRKTLKERNKLSGLCDKIREGVLKQVDNAKVLMFKRCRNDGQMTRDSRITLSGAVCIVLQELYKQ